MKLVARHALSEANNRENYGTPAFGSPEAPLMPGGRDSARMLGNVLINDYRIDVKSTPVAVSEMRRTRETAIVAGFRNVHMYSALNEEKGGLSDTDVRQALLDRSPPEATLRAARHLIENPPVEEVWITHALLIATLCQELGVYQEERFTPRFCEIRELPL